LTFSTNFTINEEDILEHVIVQNVLDGCKGDWCRTCNNLHPANTIETKWWQKIMKHQNFCASAFALSAKQSGSLMDKNGMQN
jgi:hypothetical protein